MPKKCTHISYHCGETCLPIAKKCRIGNAAIGRERLKKVSDLAKSLASGGPDPRKGLGKLKPEDLDKLADRIGADRKQQAARDLRGVRSMGKQAGESSLPDLEGMDLGQLFAMADEIGDKYLSSKEIDERTATLQAIAARARKRRTKS